MIAPTAVDRRHHPGAGGFDASQGEEPR